MKRTTIGVVVASSMLLGACGGGGGGSIGSIVTSVSPGGIYTGTLSNSFGGTTDQIVGLITENGDGVFIDQTQTAIYRLTAGVNGQSLSANFRGYTDSAHVFANGSTTETGTISGTVAERNSIQATYLGPNNTSGTVTLTYQGAQYSAPTPLSTLVGTYQFTLSVNGSSDTVTFTINSAGMVTGSDTFGCNINGSITIPNTSYDAQQFRFGTTCNGTTINYTGVSTYSPATSSSQPLLTLEYDDGNTSAVVVNAIKQ